MTKKGGKWTFVQVMSCYIEVFTLAVHTLPAWKGQNDFSLAKQCTLGLEATG